MGKKLFFLISIIALLAAYAPQAYAVDIPMAATIGGPTGIDLTILEVTPDPNSPDVWASFREVTTINFGTLQLFSFPNPAGGTFSAFLPAYYYAMDVGFTFGGGAEINGISVTYVNGAPLGLGDRGTVTFVRKALSSDGTELPETQSNTLGIKKLFSQLPQQISLTQLSGGWLRLYVGLVTKDPNLPAGDVELTDQAKIFAPGDAGGAYSGTLTVSSF